MQGNGVEEKKLPLAPGFNEWEPQGGEN